MHILIVGAGAMGSRLAIYLKKAGHEVRLLDGWKEHIEAIRDKGLEADLNGEKVCLPFPIKSFEEYQEAPFEGKDDLVIFLVKSAQLDQAVRLVKDNLHENTLALSLLNGLGHRDTLEKYLPTENILIGNTMWTAGLKGPGHAILDGDGFIAVGHPGKDERGLKKAQELADIFTEAGLVGRYAEDIGKIIYLKATVNGTLNPFSTLLEANVGELVKSLGNLDLFHEVAKEFVAVANAEGIEMTEEETFAYLDRGMKDESIYYHYPSMYQDLINKHRKTEIDYLNGAISKKGKKYNIPTPMSDLLTRLIHAKENLLEAKDF